MLLFLPIRLFLDAQLSSHYVFPFDTCYAQFMLTALFLPKAEGVGAFSLSNRDMTGGSTFTTSRSSPEMEELPVATVPEELG
jgi:hypothetical protein